MKRLLMTVMVAAIMAAACSGEKKSDLAQEMAARQMAKEINLLLQNGKPIEANEKLMELEKKFGHTKTYAEAKSAFLSAGLSTQSPKVALTGKKLIELENTVVGFRKSTGRWPAPGEVKKPVDAWHNETYFLLGKPHNSYDLLLVSAGADGKPGSGDELIVVWLEKGTEKAKRLQAKQQGDKKEKQTTGVKVEKKASGAPSLAGNVKKKAAVITLDELRKMETAAGVPETEIMSLEQLSAAGEASRKAGQPSSEEAVLSLEEIKQQF